MSETDQQNWMERLVRHRTGLLAMSVAESTAVPLPLEAVIVPLMVGHPKRALKIAFWIWIGSLVGATVFYLVGLWLRDPVVLPVLDVLGQRALFDDMIADLEEGGLFWTVFAVSFLPLPMQLATLGAGAAGGNYIVFLAAIALSRGLRYFGLAIVAQSVGNRLAHLSVPRHKVVFWGAGVLVLGWGLYKLFTL
ncbi:YqaA family protein [Sulfitobacter guttiformis]|uniref:Membrane protein YqaA with SNARE-associated domain n=1 Tax=Sulfitobacter guttiformis TaxID=74349 RepID=A0A420DMT5_9RHOB|nr:hypothetical protein [Sulfitobacter guttiformis]KIN72805.1 DedA family protein [Sulfitobacter guttiformis KCTC 32187]RKE95497.1 membrane protein YqaA with SNARE-associated domain [Sulfitobacter guttiformis]